MYNYYKDEITNVLKSRGRPQIKFTSETRSSKWMSLNTNSIPIFIEELQKLLKKKQQ